MFFTSYFYKLSMNIFFQFDFMLMKLPAFWSSVSAIVKFCIFSIPSQESVALLWFIGCMFLVMVFSSLNFMREIWFVWVWGFFWVFGCGFVFLATKSCYETPLFFLMQLSKTVGNRASRIWNMVIQAYWKIIKNGFVAFLYLHLSLTDAFLSNSL